MKDITTVPTDIKSFKKRNPSNNTMHLNLTLDQMQQFLKNLKLPNLSQYRVDNMNRLKNSIFLQIYANNEPRCTPYTLYKN